MNMDSFLRTIPVIAIAAFMLITSPVAAQTEAAPAPQQVISDAAQRMKDEEVTIMRDEYAGKYNVSTLENLSKLYWRLGAFDFDDDEAVSNYIRINDCKIYTEYINDDLEWKEIIKVMKNHLKTNASAFPLNYQFILELHLGRYDSEKGGFPLIDKTGFKDAKRIGVSSFDNNLDICYSAAPIKDYPQSLIVILDKGFTLDTLNVDEHVAQAYILRKKSEFSNLSEEARTRVYERTAYLRLRMSFSQYHGNMNVGSNDATALIYGQIDGYEIFEDAEQKRMMLSIQYDTAKNDISKSSTDTTEGLEEETTPVLEMSQPGSSTSP